MPALFGLPGASDRERAEYCGETAGDTKSRAVGNVYPNNGMLRITVLSDPSRMPDVAVLTAALYRELGGAAR